MNEAKDAIPIKVDIPDTLSWVSVPTEVMPEYVPNTTEDGTVPMDKLDAFRLARLVPGPQNPAEVTIPDMLKLVVIETKVPLSVISESPI
jgi:hypothetical protein